MKKVNEISTAPQDTQKKAFFRKEKVHIISGSQKEDHTGLYPQSAIIDSMETSFEILKDENIPILYRIALFHYFIGYIHHFYDGNGRLSRFISSYLLQQEFNSPIALKLSYAIFFKKKYYDVYKTCNDQRNKGDLTPFINAFLLFIFDAMISYIEELRDALSKFIFFYNYLQNQNLSSYETNILMLFFQNCCFSNNEITIEEIMNYTSINEVTIRKYISNFLEKKFIKKQNDKLGHKYLYSLNLEYFENMS